MMKTFLITAFLLFLFIPNTNAQEAENREPGTYRVEAERLKDHVFFLASDSLLGRGFGTEQGVQARKYIAGEFSESGLQPLNGEYVHPFNYRKGILNISGANVVGVVPGTDEELSDRYIVIGGHYDHLGWKLENNDTIVYNGADDNASGVASVIEIGRLLAREENRPGRSVILVAFDGEESGLIGSKEFVSSATVDPSSIDLMLSLDMVGMLEAHKGLDMGGIELLNDYEWAGLDLADQHGIKITKTGSSIEQRTDTAPFGSIGIPAIHAYTGTESPYHQPEDTAAALDYEGMAQVASYIAELSHVISRKPVISDKMHVEKKGTNQQKEKFFQAGATFSLGTGRHIYTNDFYEGKVSIAGAAGIMANMKLSKHFHIQPELQYESKGSKIMGGKYRSHSLSTPVKLMLYTSDYGGDFRMFFYAGGYYSWNFAGRNAGLPTDFDTEFEKEEYGINWGFGYEITSKVQNSINFQRGLSNLAAPTHPATLEMVNWNIYFTIAYIF